MHRFCAVDVPASDDCQKGDTGEGGGPGNLRNKPVQREHVEFPGTKKTQHFQICTQKLHTLILFALKKLYTFKKYGASKPKNK